MPEVVDVEPGFRVVHVDAGPVDLAKEQLPDVVDEFADGVAAHLEDLGDVDALHANYWLSGVAGHRLKHELDLPLVSTFHTLARVKAETGDPEPERRVRAEADVIGCSDAILASCEAEADQLERLYGADRRRIELVAPGVDHAFFSAGPRDGARAALHHLDLGDGPVLLFVGRIQPLKGLDVAVRALAALRRPDARLVVVGGASGAEGAVEVERIDKLVAELGVADQVRMVAPVPAPPALHLLPRRRRGASCRAVRSPSASSPSRRPRAARRSWRRPSEGSARSSTTVARASWSRAATPSVFASYAEQVLDSPALAAALSRQAAARAANYTWSTAAGRLRRVYGDLTARALVDCR